MWTLGLRRVLAQALITEFHFYFKIPTIKTKSRKKNSIDNLNEFQWNEIEAKVEIGSGSFGVAYNAKFNGNKVVVKPLRSERQAEIALFSKELR